MLAWIIVLVLLLLFLILPVGADAAYSASQFSLKLCLGPLRIKLLPGKPKPKPEQPVEKPPKPKKPKKPKDEKKLKLNKDDIFTLLGIVFKTLNSFRKHLSIDYFKLHWIAGAADPCDAVMQYGELNAGLSTLQPLAHSVLNIRREDLRTDVSFELEKPDIDAAITVTLQIWEIFFITICAGAAALRWYLKKRREARGTKLPAAQKGTE